MWEWKQWRENEENCKKIKQIEREEGIGEGKSKKCIIAKIQNFKVPHIGWISKYGLLNFI
jgi:hypothetical protein